MRECFDIQSVVANQRPHTFESNKPSKQDTCFTPL